MRVREFEHCIASITPWSVSDLDQRTRRLREHRMLPTGGRGTNAPEMAPEHAATLLIALGGAERAVDAHKAVLEYAPMVPKDTNGRDFLGSETFAEALTDILSDGALADRVEEIRICRSWEEATITYRTETGNIERQRYAPADQPETGYGFAVRNEIVFGAGFISQVALDLSQPPEDGEWVSDLKMNSGG